ncbi:unnamed protein product [Symbiodinium pilosum]|uniref:Uncharacterized protein n=1 Tax=Symbiodinium pilosum TaxID=2952 RepID=A0A812IWR8_SYMPI|nr:unnamed protein product [Symbiodinium pilosum]
MKMLCFGSLFVSFFVARTVGVTVTASVTTDGNIVLPLIRSQNKVLATSAQDSCKNGDLCLENKCTDRIFLTAQCMATSQDVDVCPGSKVCVDKSTKDTDGNLLVRFQCCCPSCQSESADSAE